MHKSIIKGFIVILFCVKSVYPQLVTFSNVTERAGVFGPTYWYGTYGTSFNDIDNDFDLDLFVAVNGKLGSGINVIYRNRGNQTFEDISDQANVPGSGWNLCGIFGDVDNDGDLDLFVTNNSLALVPSRLYLNNGNGSFRDGTCEARVGNFGGSRGAAFGDIDNDGNIDLFVPRHYHTDTTYQSNILYHNEGGGIFKDITLSAGVDGGFAYSYQGAFADYDNDGDLDLYVTNYDQNDFLYRNEGNRLFKEVASEVGIQHYSGNGVAFGDYDNDGYLDIFVTSREGNTLFHNNGDGTFEDVTDQAGVKRIGGSAGCVWGDFNNDGFLDIYVTYDGPNALFINNGNGTFTDYAEYCGVDDPRHGIGVTAGDFNWDGFLDIYLSNYDAETNILYKNEGNQNHWLIIWVKGKQGNKDGIGTRVEIVTHDNSQIREVDGGSGWHSQPSLPVEFGLGQSTMVDSLIIHWPNGNLATFINVLADQHLLVIEPDVLIAVLHDVGVDSILVPETKVSAYVPVTPMSRITNNGSFYEEEVYVTCRIDSAGTLVYSDVQSIHGLDISESQTVAFSDWVPGVGRYRLTIYTQLMKDANTSNDTLSIEVISELSIGVSSEIRTPIPSNYYLSQNYPNPFNSVTFFEYGLPHDNHVLISIYDIKGRQIATLLNKRQSAGYHRIMWDTNGLPSGIYFCQMRVSDFKAIKKIALVK